MSTLYGLSVKRSTILRVQDGQRLTVKGMLNHLWGSDENTKVYRLFRKAPKKGEPTALVILLSHFADEQYAVTEYHQTDENTYMVNTRRSGLLTFNQLTKRYAMYGVYEVHSVVFKYHVQTESGNGKDICHIVTASKNGDIRLDHKLDDKYGIAPRVVPNGGNYTTLFVGREMDWSNV